MASFIVFYIIVVLFSVVVHEVAHGYSAEALGDPTARLAGRLTLNPLKHLDPFGSIFLPALLAISGLPIIGWALPVPYNPYNLRGGRWGPAYVAVAGPLANLLIVLAFALLLKLNLIFAFLGGSFGELAMFVIQINLLLAIFNLIPLPPLDGSKILFALLPYRLRGIEEVLTRHQFILIILLLFFGAPLLISLQSFALNLISVLFGISV